MKRNACNLEIQNIDYDKTKIEVNEDNEKVHIKQEELQDNLHAFLYDTRYVVEI